MRVLIYSVSAGAGHVRAAEALVLAFKRYHPEVECEAVDVMKLVPAAFKKTYADSYLKVVNTLPSIWGMLYARADKIPQDSALITVRKFVQKLNTKALVDHAVSRQPDAIISTHFLPAEIFSDLARKKNSPWKAKSPRMSVVITDHDVHQLWVHPGIDRYYAASAEIAYLLAERHIDAGTVKATGIPCDPIFGELLDQPARQRSRKILGLSEAPSPTLLLNAHGCVSGAGAATAMAEVLSNVLSQDPPKTVLIVCGRNAKIQEALTQAVKVPPGSVVKVYGYVTNMHELMGIADLAVTKPGGLTTSECLARCLPMVLVSPIPGQEERNAEMLLENGCAVLARTPAQLTYKLETLLADPTRINRMREACRSIAHPSAAADIAADVMAMCKNGNHTPA